MKFKSWTAIAILLTVTGCNQNKKSKPDEGGQTQQQAKQQPAQEQDKNQLNVPTEPPPGLEVGLEVGMVAPEIEGEDIDGQVFKLSDYRGKVVVLDFWGDW